MADLGNTPPAEVTIETALDTSGTPVVRLAGQLDISNAPSLDAAVTTVTAAHPAALIFDLGRLEFMDSAGIAVLIRASSDVESVRVRNPTPIVRRLIEVSGLADVLRIEE